ncbi:Heterokaryon incompatibility protein 6, OR allele [Pseudocercospora fuligena]|uniref:Heterokaryon incompatibility protein 6, OR allele n=1 Tax=Pseudocercospora fuligena TaxID=685502 RepID=A0A8H6R9C2_9PEZI|nr:Heterokaryon incompatibility protein 6, OR allele [Pseudocercospora fuligena]
MGPSTSKDYTALSYCWGAMSEGQTTWVNGGHEVKIQNNLFDFLSLFSSKRFLKESLGRNASSSNSRGPLTWADALSINQNDLLEKSRELRRIGRTYSSAGQVLVWLGRELWEMKTLHFLSASPSLWQRPIHQDTLTFVRKLSAIPYFFRGWCTQELILAPAGCKGTGVVMNQHIYCWHVMESLIGDLPLDMIPVAERALVKKVKRRLLSIKKLRAVLTSKARTPTYLTLLLETSDCQCTMPVDKLYSLWSLACDARVLIPYPEYTGKVTETIDVFVSFTRFWIRHYKRLDILTFARHHDHEGLPSWVADWSQSSTGYKHILASTLANDASRDATIRDVEDHKLYCADGGATLPEEMLPVGPYNKTLTCYVNYTDHIAFVEELAPEFASSIESGSVLARVRTLHEHLLQSLAGDVSFRRQTLLVDMLQASILGRHYLEHRRVVDITEAYRFSNDVDSPAMAFVTSEDAQDSNAWEAHADSVLAYRRYAITQQGHVGLVPPNAKIGDAVNVIVGCSIPIVLRTSRNGSNRCEVVGESYFQDMMDGQMALTAKCSEIELV